MLNTRSLAPYETVDKTGESEIVISKSRFLGYCIPVESEAQAQEQLALLRKKHWDARHCCYAFRLAEGGVSRSSDDGEPSGTAGAPILNVLTQNDVKNVLCAVVRYFGGVLLGTGGLVRAYGKTASAALEAAGRVSMRLCETLTVRLSYANYSAIENAMRSGGYDVSAEFGESVTLCCRLPAEEAESFIGFLTERTDGRADITRGEITLAPVNPAESRM